MQTKVVYSTLGFSLLQDARGVFVKRTADPKYTEIIAEPEPGFPTDLQPVFAPLIAYTSYGEIEDRVFPSRFGYLEERARHGVVSKGNFSRVEIHRSTPCAASSRALDLRGGMAVLLSAICAEGRSEIDSSELILRGYDRLIDKLCSLGVEVRYE